MIEPTFIERALVERALTLTDRFVSRFAIADLRRHAVAFALLAVGLMAAGSASATELDAAVQARLGLSLAELHAVHAPVAVPATAEVLDPSTLAKAADDIAAAQAAADASGAEARRVQALFEADGNMSRKALETARAQAAADQAKLRQARAQLRMDWGAGVAVLDAGALRARVDALLDGREAWLKVEPLAAPKPGFQAVSAALHPAAGQEVVARVLGPMPRSVSGLAGGWLVAADSADLAPGMVLTANLQGAGAGASGVLLPRAAVVRWNGMAWAYVATDDTHFERRAVSALAMTADGWVVGAPFKPGEKVVSRGAEALIAQDAAPPAAAAGDAEDD